MAKLDATCQGRDIEWHWVKGHAGHPGNEMADQLANQGADETLKNPNQLLQSLKIKNLNLTGF